MRRELVGLALAVSFPARAWGQEVPKFALPDSGMRLHRATRAGVFLDVAGPRSVFLGVENGGLEGWLYPLKVFQDMELSFRLEGYPVDLQGRDIQRGIEVRPECTILTYSHSAFTVRQILLCPHKEAALVILLDIDTSLPMVVTTSFKPRLRLMWPGALPTPNVSWDEARSRYEISEEGGRFACVIGSPGARDLSTQPYQEEPKDTALRFEIPVSLSQAEKNFIPIVAAPKGADYDRVLASLPALAQELAQHYQRLRKSTVKLSLPDPSLQEAYDWSLVGMDKGMVKSPLFDNPGLVAGFRTSGESERPGFAWFFGRDALWTALASNATGNGQFTRTSLEFLRKHQRADGKIPHEISQSAPLVDWFKKFSFAWASSDATPLYIVAQGEHFRRTGDLEYLKQSWPSIEGAWNFTRATDKDGDGLMENTGVGHAWVEGGALYPPHEEIYLQGVFLEAAREFQNMAKAMGQNALAQNAATQAETVRQATEKTYWLEKSRHYAFAISKPRKAVAEPGPNRARRQKRLDQLSLGGLVEENTVLPAVPMMWGLLDAQRGQAELDQLGSAAMMADWGSRIISNQSQLYDPLAYHYGSVWPLFTGWVSLAGYRYGRPEVGFAALKANADLTYNHSLGYVTELLSGDYNSNFGRSSYHQIWSEAMVALPLVRGLAGLEVSDGGKSVEFAPQPPPSWNHFTVSQITTARGALELQYRREEGSRMIAWQAAPAAPRGPGLDLHLSLFLPRNAQLGTPPAGVELRRHQLGDQQRIDVHVKSAPTAGNVRLVVTEGTELEAPTATLVPGGRSQGLRVIRASAQPGGFKLVVDGLAGQSYHLKQRGIPLGDGGDAHATFRMEEAGRAQISFAKGTGYQRSELTLPYKR